MPDYRVRCFRPARPRPLRLGGALDDRRSTSRMWSRRPVGRPTGSATASAAGSSLELAARRPELVRRAVLLDPALWVPPDFAPGARGGAACRRSLRALRKPSRRALPAPGSAGSPTPRAPRWRRRSQEHLVESPDGRYRYRYSPEAVAAAWHEMATEPPRVRTACACRRSSCSGAARSSSAAASSRPIAPRSATCSRSSSSRAGTSSSGTPTRRPPRPSPRSCG